MKNPFNPPAQRLALLCLCSLLIFSAACNRAPTQPAAAAQSAKRYALKGKIISVDKSAAAASISNEPIPGFMDPMVMSYTIKPPSTLDRIQPGDTITADV